MYFLVQYFFEKLVLLIKTYWKQIRKPKYNGPLFKLFKKNYYTQYCAKVMRVNFIEIVCTLFSSQYCQTFDQFFTAFLQQFEAILMTIHQVKQKFARPIKKARK